jgi:hypothetical protein
MAPKKQAPKANKPIAKATPKKQATKPATKPAKKPVTNNIKQTHDKMGTLGSKAMKHPEKLTDAEIRKLGACVVSQSNPNDDK